jgi:hypothetical protein
MSGTEVNFIGLEDKAVEEAKLLFLAFSGEDVLERTKFGQILRRRNLRPARIYVKGLLVAEEPNFAFSYNVTALTQPMRKALNRERTNVGRMAYSERVKAMLLAAESTEVVEILASDLEDLATGTSHDEVRSWSDVGLRACQILNAKRSVVFVTAEELLNHKEMVDRAVEDRREVITVPSAVAEKLGSVTDFGGNALQSLSQFADEWSASIAYQFLGAEELTLGCV